MRRYTPSSTRPCVFGERKDVQVGRRPEALDQRDRTIVGLLGLEPGLIEQEASVGAVTHLQHRRHELWLCRQQQAQRNRQPSLANPHPLAHRHMGDDVVDQMRGALRHAPRPARGAESSALAAERDELVVAAIGAAQAQETVRQDAALKEGVELVLDELRQAGAGGGLDLGKEGLGVLLHQAVQRALFGAVALVVERSATLRPVRLPTVGLRALLPRL